LTGAKAIVPNTEFFKFTQLYRFIGLAFFGYLICIKLIVEKSEQALGAALLLILSLVFAAYVVIGKKMWLYHYIPVFSMLSMISAFAFHTDFMEERVNKLFGTPFKIMIVTIIILSIPFYNLSHGYYFLFAKTFLGVKHPIKDGNVEAITDFLKQNLQPGDEVVPMDVTGGAVHAMFLAQAKMGSSFIYDFHFYHHCDHPYIRELRTKFITELQTRRPRFIIKFLDVWRPHGEDACGEFPELETILNESYLPRIDEAAYQILERTN
jgi:hypothetical protein